jgi:uncharacterized protein (DUF58 family)
MMFIFVCAMNTDANLLYLVFSVMLAALLMSWFLGWINMQRLTFQRRYPVEFYAGQTVSGWMEIQNAKGRFCSYGLSAIDSIVGPLGHPREQVAPLRGFVFDVRTRGRAQAAVSIRLARRGLYATENAQLVSRHPFGLVERARNQPGSGRLLVLPRLLPTMAILPFVPRALGEVETDQKGIGHGIYGVRDYQRGDPARIIHWKHSARGQGYKVKEFEQEEARGFRLMLDLQLPPEGETVLEEDFEKAVSVTASLARMLIRRGMNVGLWTSIGNVPVEGGPEHLMRLLRALAQVQMIARESPIVAPAKIEDHIDEFWIEFRSRRHPSAGQPFATGARRSVIDARRVHVVDGVASEMEAR